MEIGVVMINEYNEKCIEIKSKEMNVRYIEGENSLEQLQNLQGLILYVKSKQAIQEIYRLILKIKKISDSPMWIVTEKITDFDRFMFLQLGVLGTIQESVVEEELPLVLKNTFSHLRKNIEKPVELEDMTETDIGLKLIDRNMSICFNGSVEVVLTKIEYKLISLLADSPNDTVTYKCLNESLWKNFEDNEQYYRVANIVFHLRKKFKQHSLNPDIIKTIRSRGYMLCV